MKSPVMLPIRQKRVDEFDGGGDFSTDVLTDMDVDRVRWFCLRAVAPGREVEGQPGDIDPAGSPSGHNQMWRRPQGPHRQSCAENCAARTCANSSSLAPIRSSLAETSRREGWFPLARGKDLYGAYAPNMAGTRKRLHAGGAQAFSGLRTMSTLMPRQARPAGPP